MKAQIKLLENNLINKIAAGEVIERPASIVKELVENSIDAQSQNITIEIKNGGISYIKIQDDGIGIPKEQIKTAFLRHATSKLEKLDDLDNILTLGFRGEALASIASISMVEMSTSTNDKGIGNKIVIEGGEIIKEEETATLKGTTFIIKNIFFNTPARRKFLKKQSIEASYITEIVNRLVLANPNICFTYINNGVEILKTTGDGNLKNTIFCIYGKEIAKKIVPINEEKNGFSIQGFIGKPELCRGNRSYENFFINGRYIKSSLIQKAIEEGYGETLMISKFPVFVINMTVPENTVDVNVHPTKLEVRFEDENFIHQFLCEAIQNTLKNQVLIPNIENQQPKTFFDVTNTKPINAKVQQNLENLLIEDDDFDIQSKEQTQKPFVVEENNHFDTPKKTIVDIVYNKPKTDDKYAYIEDKTLIENNINIDNNVDIVNENVDKKQKETYKNIDKVKKHSFFNNYKIVGQIFNTYWIVEQNDEMYLIDQHSAHERIIFEQLTENFKNQSIHSQKLLEPIVIKATPMEKMAIEQNKELFLKFGFDIEEFGFDTYALRQVPFIFNAPVEPLFFIDLLNIVMDKNISNLYDAKIEKIISMSCKKAVKANDRLNFVEAKQLIEKLLNIENPFNCPHGRPTIIKMTKYEIEKMFKRIQN